MTTACLSVADAAELLACSPEHVTRLIRDGDLRGFRVGRRRWSITVKDYEAFIAARRDRPER